MLALALLLVLTLALVPPLALLLALALALQKTQSVTVTQAFNRGRTRMPLRGGGGRKPSGPTYDFAKISKKLHEIDPPMLKALFNCIFTSTVFR